MADSWDFPLWAKYFPKWTVFTSNSVMIFLAFAECSHLQCQYKSGNKEIPASVIVTAHTWPLVGLSRCTLKKHHNSPSLLLLPLLIFPYFFPLLPSTSTVTSPVTHIIAIQILPRWILKSFYEYFLWLSQWIISLFVLFAPVCYRSQQEQILCLISTACNWSAKSFLCVTEWPVRLMKFSLCICLVYRTYDAFVLFLAAYLFSWVY